MKEEFLALQKHIELFIRSSHGDFGSLALRAYEFQFAYNLPYRAYCESLSATPRSVSDWKEIPPAPAEAFNYKAPLSCYPPGECEWGFLTSGTTREVRGRHHLADLALYPTAVRSGFERLAMLPPLFRVFLAGRPEKTPESSLATMFHILAEEAGSQCWLLAQSGEYDPGPLPEIDTPALVFATALTLHHLIEDGTLPRLPQGSWVFQTGGYKGLKTTYDQAALYDRIGCSLGVSPERILNEYGMTELSSQAYSLGLGNAHQTPPWLKVRALHPETGQWVSEGGSGQLVFYDLANLNSVCALRTQDIGTVLDQHHFLLEGRDPEAPLRGCSRASDAFFQHHEDS